MTARACLGFVVALLALAGVPAAAQAATVNVNGKGAARFQTQKSAEVIGVRVNAPGRVRLIDLDNPGAASFKPKCIRRAKKPCVRRDRKTGDWIVLRAVRFIYDGQGFTMRVTSRIELPRHDLRRRPAEAERQRHVHAGRRRAPLQRQRPAHPPQEELTAPTARRRRDQGLE